MKHLDLTTVPLNGKNLVEASAGTGKTYTISNLYLRFILEAGLQVDQILVVTFTEAATRELKERLRENLDYACRILKTADKGEEFKDHPDDPLYTIIKNFCQPLAISEKIKQAAKRLRHAVLSFDEAAIFTIHGFCQRMLSENALESALPFKFEVLSDESKIIRVVVQDYWRSRVNQGDQTLAMLVERAGLNLEKLIRLAEAVKGVTLGPDTANDEKKPDMFIHPLMEDDDLEGVIRDIEGHIKKIEDISSVLILKLQNEAFVNEVTELLETAKIFNKPYGKKKDIWALAAHLLDSLLSSDFYELAQGYFTASHLQEKLNARARKKGCTLPEHELFILCEKIHGAASSLSQKLEKGIILFKRDFITFFIKEYEQLKGDTGVLSFDDILLRLRKALINDPSGRLKRNIQNRFKAAMIDEFQDTDPVQYEIFQNLFLYSPTHIIFLIGDPKQSIYRFRGADIFAYLQAKKLVSPEKQYTLYTNYRSETGMVKATNRLFLPMSEGRADVKEENGFRSFIEHEILFETVKASEGIKIGERFFTEKDDKTARLQILHILKDPAGDQTLFSSDEAQRAVCVLVTRKVVELLNHNENRPDKNGINPSDIAILVKSHRQAKKLQEYLQACSVPCVIQNSGNIFKTPEAEDMRRLIEALSTQKEGSVRALLLTNFKGLGLEEASFIDERHLIDLYNQCRIFSIEWQESGFMSFFRMLLMEWNVTARVLALPQGERIMTNYLHLAELIHQYSLVHHKSIQDISDWFVKKMNETEEVSEYEVRLEKDSSALKIMTVHSSKGLEFNIVFCPFEWDRKFVPWHCGREGYLCYYNRDKRRREIDLAPNGKEWERHKEYIYLEQLSESLRLLYVAVTRAKHRCYVVSGDFKGINQSSLNYLLKRPDGDVMEYIRENNPVGPGSLAETTRLSALFRDTVQRSGAAQMSFIPENDIFHSPFTQYCPRLNNRKDLATKTWDFEHNLIDRSWMVGSFSSLVKNLSHGQVLPETADDLLKEEQGIETFRESQFELPRGAGTGNALHGIMEQLDFKSKRPDPLLIESQIRKHGLAPNYEGVSYQESVKRSVASMEALISRVLNTPLPVNPPFCLKDIGPEDSLSELEFFYPVSSISPNSLKKIFSEYGAIFSEKDFAEDLGAPGFSMRHGFMHGFIDLVFKKDNQYFLLDWKTNYLGKSPDDYSDRAIKKSMSESFYLLQYHIYTVALHLYLEKKVAGYSYERSFGGVFYTFVRGMRPEKPGSGVYYHWPEPGLIQALVNTIVKKA